MSVERRDVVGLVFALAIAAACGRLGFWQLDRLAQRRARNAVLRAARARPLLEVTRALAPDSARDRRLHARGVYDYRQERFWHGRSRDGVPGVDLITPVRLADGSAVLVDRGWAPSTDGYHVEARFYRESDSADVIGLGSPAPRGRGDVDPAKLADSLPYPLQAFVVVALSAAGGAGTGARTPNPTPTRWPLPELSDGPHLSYAIQWFGFALIILVGSIALLKQRRGGVGAGAQESSARAG
jgi:surfeit locus 1 family protein